MFDVSAVDFLPALRVVFCCFPQVFFFFPVPIIFLDGVVGGCSPCDKNAGVSFVVSSLLFAFVFVVVFVVFCPNQNQDQNQTKQKRSLP